MTTRLPHAALLALLGLAGSCDGSGDSDATPAPPSPGGSAIEWKPSEFAWPMQGQNPRRTSRSPFTGPRTATDSGRNWTYRAAGAA